MNSYTGSESKNHDSIDSTKKRDAISPNRSEMENNGLHDVVGVDVVLSTSTLNQYDNMEYNNEHHNVFSNGNISTPNNSSVSTFTPPSVTSTNDE